MSDEFLHWVPFICLVLIFLGFGSYAEFKSDEEQDQ